MAAHELEFTAAALVAEGKGILAADESTGTVTKRLEAVDIDSTEEIRHTYRRLLATAGAGVSSSAG
jgi:Fructose-1,6-bisphosphate aldolase